MASSKEIIRIQTWLPIIQSLTKLTRRRRIIVFKTLHITNFQTSSLAKMMSNSLHSVSQESSSKLASTKLSYSLKIVEAVIVIEVSHAGNAI